MPIGQEKVKYVWDHRLKRAEPSLAADRATLDEPNCADCHATHRSRTVDTDGWHSAEGCIASFSGQSWHCLPTEAGGLGQWPLAEACIGSGPADTQILQTIEEWLLPLKQFVVLLCDQTSSLNYVNKARVQLFTEKGRAINRLPPPLHRLLSFSI